MIDPEEIDSPVSSVKPRRPYFRGELRKRGGRAELHGGRQGLRRGLAGVVVGGLGISAAVTLLPMPGLASTSGPTLVGHLKIPFSLSSESATMSVDPSMRRGYLVHEPFGSADHVYVVDLARLVISADILAPDTLSIGQGNNHDPDAVVDEAHRRVIFYDYGPTSPAGSCQGTLPALAELDETSLHWKVIPIPCIPSDGDVMQVTGMTYDARSSTLYLLGLDEGALSYHNALQAAPTPYDIVQIDPATGKALSQIQLHCNYSAPIVPPVETDTIGRTGDVMVATCPDSSPTVTAATSNQAYMAVERVSLEAGGRLGTLLQDEPELGSNFGSLLDPASGLVVMPSTDPAYDLGAYVFDTTSGLFRGFVPTSNDQSLTGDSQIRAFGINTSTGRLYMQTRKGLIVSDFRQLPVPAGLLYVGDGSDSNASPLMITADPFNSRIFVPSYGENAFDVYEDHSPSTANAVMVNPDAATTDVPEIPGTTSATYTGSGDAFGARLLSEGGLNRVLESRLGSCGPNYNTSHQQVDAVMDCPYNVFLNPGDRDWTFGHVAAASLTNVGASAAASSLDVDTSTARDFQTWDVYGTEVSAPTSVPDASPTPIAVPGLAGPSPAPSYPAARFPADRSQDMPACHDFGGAPSTNAETSAAGHAALSCNQANGDISARSAFTPGDGALDLVANPFSATSSVDVTRSPASGLITTSEASVKDVHLPPVPDPSVYIREIDTVAESAAHGRPGTASGKFIRHIYGFSSVGQPGTAMDYSCSDDSTTPCDPQKVVAAIDAAFSAAGLKAAAYISAPDPTFISGTPGGYQAVITKASFLVANDHTVNDDNADTVAGLEIVIYNDGSAGRSRQILQFAGVHAESHYGIYQLGADTSDIGGLDSAADAGGPSTGTTPVVSAATATNTGGAPTISILQGRTNPLIAIAHHIADVFQEGWRLLVSDPKTAALLAGVWALLGTPVYLAIRRRSLASNIARGVV